MCVEEASCEDLREFLNALKNVHKANIVLLTQTHGFI